MVTPRTDMEMWGREEVWSYPEGIGDCEDYALEKRRQLMALGVPSVGPPEPIEALGDTCS